jgi:hypothetical protein
VFSGIPRIEHSAITLFCRLAHQRSILTSIFQ